MSGQPVLLDIGADAYAHQEEVDHVKQKLGVSHSYFDCWIYGFLENKSFKCEEAIAKLRRREAFEREVLAQEEVTEWMVENMRKGIIQVIGNDKAGRVVFYVCTARDRPQASRREEARKNFDMLLAYGTRLRPESKRCQIAMLINQEKASMWSNVDMSFQADIALRIAKYYPGMVDKMYICNMGRALSAIAKPIFHQLPSIVSDRIKIISDSDMKKGRLLDLFDAHVLPVALGGTNDCDRPENYLRFSNTIKEYFEQLKAAIARGSTVKEWELTNLLSHAEAPSTLALSPDLHRTLTDLHSPHAPRLRLMEASWSSPGDVRPDWSATSDQPVRCLSSTTTESPDGLHTCDSLDWATAPSLPGDGAALQDVHLLVERALDVEPDLFTEYLGQFTLLESFFRLSVTEVGEREWVHLLQREAQARQTRLREEGEFRGDAFGQALPRIPQTLLRGILWVSLMTTALYFLLATLFIVALGGSTLIRLFFAMFTQPFVVFPYGAAFTVIMVECAMLCSRSFELMRWIFRGRLLPLAPRCGRFAALPQAVLYVSLTTACLLVFCILSLQRDLYAGAQYSLMIGWMAAALITFLYHVVFALGLRSLRRRQGSSSRRREGAEITLYLILDVRMDDDDADGGGHPARRLSWVSVLVVGLFMGLTGILGLLYFLRGGVGLLCMTVLLPLLAFSFAVVIVLPGETGSAESLFVSVGLYTCLVWMDAVFTLPAYGWVGGWGASFLTVLSTLLVTLMLCLLCVYGPWRVSVRQWFFRVAWLVLLLHLLGCVVALLVENYVMGLLVAAFAVHLLVTVFRNDEVVNTYGTLTIGVCFTFFLLTCCMLGWSSRQETYDTAASGHLLPDYASRGDGGTNTLSPLCTVHFSPFHLDIVGVALLTKLGYAADPAARETDRDVWFPGLFEASPLLLGPQDVLQATVLQANTTSPRTTVVAVRGGWNVYLAMESMTLWMDLLSISFISFTIPSDYLSDLVGVINFIEPLCPLRSKRAIDIAAKALMQQVPPVSDPAGTTYLIGHGLPGAMGALMALKSGLPMEIVIFASPSLFLSAARLGLRGPELAQRLLSVHPSSSPFAFWELQGDEAQTIECTLGGNKCSSLDTVVRTLDALCSPH